MHSGIARRVVTWLSIVMGVVGFGVFVLFHVRHHRPPLWDDALFAYGGVFTIVLLMNSFGRQAAMLRAESDALKRRPTPRPAPRPELAVALASAPAAVEDIRLVRVKAEDGQAFLAMADAAVTEVLALEERRPTRDVHGHVQDVPVINWLENRNHYCFFIQYHGETTGTCVLVLDEQKTASIQLLYVVPEWRRRGVGRCAVQKVLEFAALLDAYDEISVEFSNRNARSRKFFQSLGFTQRAESQGAEIWSRRVDLDVAGL